MKKPFENRKVIDPSRLKYVIKFSKMIAPENDSGGTRVSYPLLLETKAARSEINAYDQLALAASATVFNGDCYYWIRSRACFRPEKDMRVVVNSEKYTIRGFAPINDPITYWKILCVKSDWDDED